MMFLISIVAFVVFHFGFRVVEAKQPVVYAVMTEWSLPAVFVFAITLFLMV